MVSRAALGFSSYLPLIYLLGVNSPRLYRVLHPIFLQKIDSCSGFSSALLGVPLEK